MDAGLQAASSADAAERLAVPAVGKRHRKIEAVADDPDAELQRARHFNCGCQAFKNSPCILQFTAEEIVNIRLDLRELTGGNVKSEQTNTFSIPFTLQTRALIHPLLPDIPDCCLFLKN